MNAEHRGTIRSRCRPIRGRSHAQALGCYEWSLPPIPSCRRRAFSASPIVVLAQPRSAAGQDFDSKHHWDPTMKRIQVVVIASALVVLALDPLGNRAGAQTARDSVLA